MTRIVFVFGLISGVVTILGILGTLVIGTSHHDNLWLGYLIMLVALSSILVGVKQHRDRNLGGVIRFWPALGIGLAIAVVASIAYVLVWEAYLAATHYSFMGEYVEAQLAAKRAAGVAGPAYAKAVAEMETLRVQYRNPLYRLPMTFIEIFPVGFVIAVVSAALVRNPKFLPARSRPAP